MSQAKLTLLLGTLVGLGLLLLGATYYHYTTQRVTLTQAPLGHPPPPANEASRLNETILATRRYFIRQMTVEALRSFQRRPPPLTALSTLSVMNLTRELSQAARWLPNGTLNLEASPFLLVADTVVDYLGSLLSVYALEHDPAYLKQAREIAHFLRPAYNYEFENKANKVIAYRLLDSVYKFPSAPYPLSSELLVQSPIYLFLSKVTRSVNYTLLTEAFQSVLQRLTLESPLLRPIALDPLAVQWEPQIMKVKARELESTFYWSLLNCYLMSKGSNRAPLRWFEGAIEEAVETQLTIDPQSKEVYVRSFFDGASSRSSEPPSMGINSCTMGAILALGARVLQSDLSRGQLSLDVERKANETLRYERYFQLGEAIIETCHRVSSSSRTGLPPGRWYIEKGRHRFDENNLAYNLGPQLAQSYFLLHRLTGHPKYQKYAWQLTESIYNYARSPADGAFHSVVNVNERQLNAKNAQPAQGHFLGSTLKYLYLIHTEALPIEQWIFSESGQPLPMVGDAAFEATKV